MSNKIIATKKDKKKMLKEVNDGFHRFELIEKICRKICENENINPEKLICRMMPQLLNYPFMGGYYLPNPQFTMPAWMLYKEWVEIVLNITTDQEPKP